MTDYNTSICAECGLEKRLAINPVKKFTSNQPLWVGYSRSSRFQKLLNSLFYPLIWGSIPGKCRLHLDNAKTKYESVEDLMKALRKVNTTTKNYNNLHLYAILYLQGYNPPTPPPVKIQHDMVGDFVILEKGLCCLYPTRRFFSYRWVLTQLLHKYKLTEYIQFVKPLVNQKSNKRYSVMFKEIFKTAGTPLAIRDVPQTTAKSLSLFPDDDCLSQLFSCASRHLAKSDPRTR